MILLASRSTCSCDIVGRSVTDQSNVHVYIHNLIDAEGCQLHHHTLLVYLHMNQWIDDCRLMFNGSCKRTCMHDIYFHIYKSVDASDAS